MILKKDDSGTNCINYNRDSNGIIDGAVGSFKNE